MAALKAHADRKAMLEAVFDGESGTGLGVTMEFYSLCAAELQKSSLALWVNRANENEEGSLSEFTVNSGGLFPVPIPASAKEYLSAAEVLFSFAGRLAAKAIQDERVVDLPLSELFWKAVLGKPLRLDDYLLIDKRAAEALLAMEDFVKKRKAILASDANESEKLDALSKLCIVMGKDSFQVEDLYLSMQYLPPAHNLPYDSVDLVPNGSHIEVNAENLEEFVCLSTEFIMKSGIQVQVDAFVAGFNEVFPISTLRILSVSEIRMMLNGDRYPKWTFDELLENIDAKNGYTKGSDHVLWFLGILAEFSPDERKKFLRFATGCDSLPAGGISSLTPRMTIVMKTDDPDVDMHFPSVNCCFHFIKLPAYSSQEIMKQRLLTAMETTGFYFN
uniref:HECT domain-containing protein n=1 Tax=Palpitomonas bilix TaxID=652834 RepID=A0A7S3CZ44_9EUKA